MAIKCPSCGGFMHYDINGKNLRCIHCDTVTGVNDYTNTQEAKKSEDAEAFEDFIEYNIFECPDCGAQTRVLEEQSTLFCPYCGRQSFFRGNERSEKPVDIIPFEIDKDRVKEEVGKKLKSKLFSPSSYLADEESNEYRGVYIPYWSFDARFVNGDFVILEGRHSYTRGSYDYDETYRISATLNMVRDTCFDASQAFEDTIATAISPFYSDNSVGFNEAYAAGFYIDKETTPKETYLNSGLVLRENTKQIEKEVEKALDRDSVKMDTVEVTEGMDNASVSSNLNYFPVWFNTRRVKDRVLYSVVNGQTGKTYMDLPVDKRKFTLSWLILSVPLVILCYVLFTSLLGAVSAKIISFISVVFHLLFMGMLLLETGQIKANDEHLHDAGNLGQKSGKSLFNYIPGNIIFILISAAALIVSLVLIFSGKPDDKWYYAATILNFAGMAALSLGCIRGFDYLSSRPAPNFFTREGGNNNEENS